MCLEDPEIKILDFFSFRFEATNLQTFILNSFRILGLFTFVLPFSQQNIDNLTFKHYLHISNFNGVFEEK